MPKSYIYGEREYVLTGRKAKKERASGRIETKFEIRPVEVTDPEDRTHNKWVVMKELYSVRNEDEDDNDGDDE